MIKTLSERLWDLSEFAARYSGSVDSDQAKNKVILNLIRRTAEILSREVDDLGIEATPDRKLNIPFALAVSAEVRLMLRDTDIFGLERDVNKDVIGVIVKFTERNFNDPELSVIIRHLMNDLRKRIAFEDRNEYRGEGFSPD